ncbi:hypothetical protein Pan216_12850 [Planctomycetes bacterium Pan216]|uniref:Uncharacterized protein n=1 Tax=Kolteria novifilia TaxID=2527975 RepID=A0A518B0F5_9BACT|nr:hypothetical protein Pan216_12850 [Planctomycetes bacterium Pan216]
MVPPFPTSRTDELASRRDRMRTSDLLRGRAKLSGYVYIDLNQDGQRDADEPGIPRV